jgi:SAM-dependent methyltransferase
VKVAADELLEVLRNPECPGEALRREEGWLVGAESGRRIPIRPSGMIDFALDPEATSPPATKRPAGILFRLNEFYNTRFEQALANSIWAGGGIAAYSLQARIARWLAPIEGRVVDVGSGAEQWKAFVSPRARYMSLDYLPVSALSPWRVAFPDINADALRMPIRDASVDAAINVSVIEHVRDPRRLVSELARILKPGGMLVLAGPGDILMSHGEPYHFFNLTKYGYRMLLEENGLEPIEEHIPGRFWVSVLGLAYNNLVRNNAYNRSAFHKLIQVPVFALSLLLSPPLNLLAWILDRILPFDERGYTTYMVLARKKAS